MIKDEKHLEITGYYGLVSGVNVNTSELLQRNSELIESINLDSTKLGTLKKSLYKTQYGVQIQDNKSVRSGFVFVDGSGNAHKLVAIDDDDSSEVKIYELGASSNTLKKEDLAVLDVDYITLLGYLFIINSTDGISTTTDLSTWGTVNAVSAPSGEFIEEFNNEPYVFGNSSKKYRVYKGKLHNPAVEPVCFVVGDQTSATTTTITVDSTRYLKANQKIDIYQRYTKTKRTNADSLTIASITSKTTFTISSTNLTLQDSDEIYIEDTYGATPVMGILWDTEEDNFDLPPNGENPMGLKKNGNRLIMWQENTMHRWDGAVRTEVSATVGLSAKKSPAEVDGKLFWNHKGVFYAYDGSEPIPISQKIQPILDSVSNYSTWVGVGDETNKVYACYIGNVDCDQLKADNVWAIYYVNQDKWEFLQDINATCAFKDKTGTGSETIYLGDNDGNIWKFKEGTTVSAYSMKSKYDSQGKPEMVKEYRYIVPIMAKPGGKLFYSLDFSGEYHELGEIRENVQAFSLPVNTSGHFISIAWADNASGESPELIGYSVLYEIKGIKI